MSRSLEMGWTDTFIGDISNTGRFHGMCAGDQVGSYAQRIERFYLIQHKGDGGLNYQSPRMIL